MSLPDSRPDAPVRTQTFRTQRPDVVGSDVPTSPYPICLAGTVERGFGRGGKELGCPTANLSDDALNNLPEGVTNGIYFGYARVFGSADDRTADLSGSDAGVHPMVMSLGWNPYYKNEKLTTEIHLLHTFERDFYGHYMKVVILGYIRPELDYTSREDLIDDINKDKQVGLNSLDRPSYSQFKSDAFLMNQHE